MLSNLYPMFLMILSFFFSLSIFFFFKKDSSPKCDYRVPKTEKIDKLINNDNQGKSIAQYKESLEQYDIKYLAWRASQNVSPK